MGGAWTIRDPRGQSHQAHTLKSSALGENTAPGPYPAQCTSRIISYGTCNPQGVIPIVPIQYLQAGNFDRSKKRALGDVHRYMQQRRCVHHPAVSPGHLCVL